MEIYSLDFYHRQVARADVYGDTKAQELFPFIYIVCGQHRWVSSPIHVTSSSDNRHLATLIFTASFLYPNPFDSIRNSVFWIRRQKSRFCYCPDNESIFCVKFYNNSHSEFLKNNYLIPRLEIKYVFLKKL